MSDELQLSNGVLAFRGYNVTNIGRSRELLQHDVYGPLVQQALEEASEVCESVVERKVDLVGRVERGEDTTLEVYDEAIALIVSMEIAQLKLLSEFHGIDYSQARVSIGFSLGEISALVAGGVYEMSDAIRIPLAMAADCADLAKDVSMGVLFSQGSDRCVSVAVPQLTAGDGDRGYGETIEGSPK